MNNCLVFAINALMRNMNLKSKPHGFMIMATTTLLNEVAISLLSI